MVQHNGRLTLPAFGDGGDWIVKLPDRVYPDVPRNEHTMMSLAAAAGIIVPELRLVHRDQVADLPTSVWPEHEQWAYAIRRFDRDEQRRPVHIEDLAQVRNVDPDAKYHGNFETVAALLYRAYDLVSTATYRAGDAPEDLGLKFGGTRRFEGITLRTFARLQERLNVGDARLPDIAAETVERVRRQWPDYAPLLADNESLVKNITASINERSRTLLRHG